MSYRPESDIQLLRFDVRSCHIGPSRTSNCFDLNYPEDALYIYIIKKYIYIKPISRFNRSPKR
uniref:Uncharacterized protein n=1 Tax=Bridelia tomentosa TaxID=300990 RepID=A0A8E7DN61_9ROSI|nr:hypothetical protein [Bridelia tomentosa]